jgi:hypothetical protein
MWRIQQGGSTPTTLCDGIGRREVLRVGGLSALGIGLDTLRRRPAGASEQPVGAFGRARSAIMIWLLGGPPQHESWDPKPDAPAEVRGEFAPIATAAPGTLIGELMPRTARCMADIAALRAVVTGDNAHSSSGYQMLTGVPHQPMNQENATAKAPNLWPSTTALVRALRPDQGGLPSAIALPNHIAHDGEIVWPGQGAGFLPQRCEPWLIRCDPSAAGFRVPALSMPEGFASDRFDRRRSLLAQVNGFASYLDHSANVERFDDQTRQALNLLTGRAAREAFDIASEPAHVRDRYGRTQFGQSVLLARRLIEAGVSLVQVNWQRLAGKANNGTWDTHTQHAASLKDFLMPIMDQAYSALLEDLRERGLLGETLVGWLGEFGHTPKVNRRAGRDHWGRVFSVALAGGGIRGGVVHGTSDAHAAEPVAGRVEPRDITATIFHCLGHSPETLIHDNLGRPIPISRGRVIEEVL